MKPLRPVCTSIVALPLLLGLAACRRDAEVPPVPAAGETPPSVNAPDPVSRTSRLTAPLPGAVAEALRGLGVDLAAAEQWTDRGGSASFRFRVSGADAIATWKTLRAAVERTGHWPVVVGPTAEQTDVPDDGSTPSAVLARAGEVDFGAVLEQRKKEDPEAFEAERGEWPDQIPTNETFIVPLDIRTQKPLPEVWIALVPTRNSWEVPAYLAFGDWNECPPDEVHVAALRKWHEEWGAELVCLTRDTMELLVSKRPSSRKAAMALANSQYLYCADTVDQGLETISALAADRMTSPVWYFWWD